MALPVDGLLSPEPHPAAFVPPRDNQKLVTEDWSLGGAALNDSTAGLDIATWRFEVVPDTGIVNIEKDGVLTNANWYTIPGASVDTPLVDFAAGFDTNMQPVLSWGDRAGYSYYRWFNPTLPGFETVTLAFGSYSARVDMDDPREGQNSLRDTIIAYIRGTHLYYRQLRDRFLVEYDLGELPETEAAWRLNRMGMNELYRLQFELKHVQGNPVPIIDYIVPSQTPAGSGALALTINGFKFIDGTLARVDGVDVATTFISREQLIATIPASVTAVGGAKDITLFTRWPAGGESDPVTLTVIS